MSGTPEREANLDWANAFATALEALREGDGMWQGVHVRLLAISMPRGSDERIAYGAHFQLSPDRLVPSIKARITDPLFLEGFLGIDEFAELLAAWRDQNPAAVGDYPIKPPDGIPFLDWRTMGLNDPNHEPLIEELPEHRSAYRVDRLMGYGGGILGETYNHLIGAIARTHPEHAYPENWAFNFMRMRWRLDGPSLLVQFPLAVGVDATYDVARHEMVVNVHFRPPLASSDFDVRTGADHWDASSQSHKLVPAADDVAGWHVATYRELVVPGGLRKVWVSRRGSPNQFDWMVTVDLGHADTAARRRRTFLDVWYGLANRPFGLDIARRPPMPKDDQRTALALEVALANACAAAGLAVIFGGGALSTPGVDFIAFDEDRQRAYAVSATVSNVMSKKLEELIRVESEIRDALEPLWEVRFVIVSSDPTSRFMQGVVTDANERRIRLFGEEVLEGLRESPPNPESFVAALRRSTN